jgi:hypothetical protein
VHPERAFTDLGAAHDAIQAVLTGHEPNPAMAVNVRWELLASNEAAARFLAQVPPALREPPVNVLRATLHPDGLSSRILNLRSGAPTSCVEYAASSTGPPPRGSRTCSPSSRRTPPAAGPRRPTQDRHVTGSWSRCASRPRAASSPSSTRPPSSGHRVT